MRKDHEKRYHKFRKKYFIGKKCAWCGHIGNIHYHHIKPSEKKHNVSRMWCYSQKKIDEEIAKCIPLCANCHYIIHQMRGDIINE